MSDSEAKRILGLEPGRSYTDDEVRKVQRQKVVQLGHERGGDQSKIVEVNVAADYLVGKDSPSSRPSRSDDLADMGRDVDFGVEPPPPPKKHVTTFEEAASKASIPTGVRWIFVTESARSGYASDEVTNEATGYVAVGELDDKWVLVSVQHWNKADHFAGAGDSYDVYEIKDTKITRPDKPTPQQLYGAVKKAWGGFTRLEKDFNSKIKLLPPDWAFKDFSKKYMALHSIRSTTIKNYLVDSGQVAEGDLKVPRKIVVEIRYSRAYDSKPNHYHKALGQSSDWEALGLVINGKEQALSEDDLRKLGKFRVGGKKFMERVFGEYYYGGEVKNLTRNKDGKAIMTWMAENLSLDSATVNILQAAAGAAK